MAKVTIGFADYEEPTWEEYTGEDPPVGKWFNAELKKVQHKSDDEALLFIFEISDGDFAGWGRGVFAPYAGERKWKSQQTIRALQGGLKKDVTLDWDNDKAVAAWVAKTKPVKIKIGEYNDRVNIDKVAPLMEAVGAPKGATPSAPAEPEVDEEAPEDYTEDELAEMEVADLEEILEKEFEEDLPKKPRRGGEEKYKELLIDAILEAQEADEEEDDQPGNPDGGDEEFEDGFDDEEGEPEPEPEPAPRARRSRATTAAPAKATPAVKAAAARRRRS